jgi:hypothetical protein
MTATITTVGLEYLARYANQSTVGSFKYLAIGSGTTAESDTHTALAIEHTGSGLARAAATCSYESSYKSVWTYTFTNNTGSSVAVNEGAVFDAASGGHMLMRGVLPVTKNLAAAETLEVEMKLAQSV